MAEFDDSGERSEEATDTRREEFRKRGEVAQTRELASAVFMIVSAALLVFLGSYFYEHILRLFNRIIDIGLDRRLELFQKLSQVQSVVAQESLFLLLPFLLLSLFIGVGSSWLQTGFVIVENAFDLNFDRINPVQGFKRIFSLRSLMEALKALLKFTILVAIFYWFLRADFYLLLRGSDLDWFQWILVLGKVTSKMLFLAGGFLLLLAGIDYWFVRWSLEKKMMMTKQELKEELKNREIDPLLKSRMRRMQREVAQKRMMAQVPKADVVITNPTHIAVALRYTPEMPAPQLIAKGADRIAEKIKEIARQHGIPIVENKPLARTIFKTMKLDQFIPRELYVAVAEVLSYVYRLKRKKMS